VPPALVVLPWAAVRRAVVSAEVHPLALLEAARRARRIPEATERLVRAIPV
jgi:hypothetical protein